MRKALLVPLVFFSILIAGCDNGTPIKSEQIPSNLKVLVERLDVVILNEKLTVYAMDFRKEGRILTFVCPCHIAGRGEVFLNVRVEGDLFKLTLLPDAEYEVKVSYWAPNADNNTEIKFRTSR